MGLQPYLTEKTKLDGGALHSVAQDAQLKSAGNSGPITRSDLVWMDDGNLVLQAENKQFCVHQSILARNSTVFRDMFMVSSPNDASQERVDGRPIVRLSDDPAHVESFLRAIYDRRFFAVKNIPFQTFEGVFRMTAKYGGSKDLRDEGREMFSHDFPNTLVGWDTIVKKGTYTRPDTALNEDSAQFLTWHNTAPSLARECNMRTVLPSALFRIVRDLTIERIYESDALSAADKRVCLIATERLRDKLFTVYRHLTLATPSCGKEKCDLAILKEGIVMGSKAGHAVFWRLLDADGLTELKESMLCSFCIARCETMFHKERAALWDELPEIFGLPPWDQLRKEEANAFSDHID